MNPRSTWLLVAAALGLASACGDDNEFTNADRDLLRSLADAGTGTGGELNVTANLSDEDRALLHALAADASTTAPDLSQTCDAIEGGLERVGDKGKFLVRLVASEPAVLETGLYDWTIQVLDTDHQPLNGATVEVTPWIVEHDHGTDSVTVTGAASGIFDVSGINLTMGGLWEIRIAIAVGSTKDTVVFRTCVTMPAAAAKPFVGGALYVFSMGPADGEATITVINTEDSSVIKEINVPAANWSDAVTSADHRRVFINERNGAQVLVIDTGLQMIETKLDVGGSPVHIFNPNHGTEVWSHSDTEGAFYAIDAMTLDVTGPIQAALTSTGHGKLIYDPWIAPKAFATNVTSAAAFPVDLAHKSVGYAIPLCEGEGEVPCASDADCDAGFTCAADSICRDGSAVAQMQAIGGTHDKAISPFNGKAYFQCSGGVPGFGIIDAVTEELLDNSATTMNGSVALSPDHRFILLTNTMGDDDPANDIVDILDTANDDPATDDYKIPDYTLSVPGDPSPRGIDFSVVAQNVNTMHAIIPTAASNKVFVVDLNNLSMLASMPSAVVTKVSVGTYTPPAGATHVNRYGVVGAGRYWTVNDKGIVAINLGDMTVSAPIAIKGNVSRLTFADNSGAATPAGTGSTIADHVH